MPKTLLKRILASMIDYGIVASYAAILFFLTTLLSSAFNWSLNDNPFIGQCIGFMTLTLPVLLYSYLTEKSHWRGTVGKKLLKLVVLTDQDHSSKNILIRNILKYLPWELAHTGVHWIIYYTSNNMETPLWTWIILIFPQLIVIAYFVSIILSKGQRSIYDNFAKTNITLLMSAHTREHSMRT